MKRCHCSQYEATSADLTEEDLENGDYEVHTTGCAAHTSRLFAPGHDAKLKSALIRWHVAGLDVAYFDGGVRVYSDALTVAGKHGFGPQVASGIAKAQERAEAKSAKKAEKRHDGNAARQDREARSLADRVAEEEAAHAEAARQQVAQREASADWDDEAPVTDLTGRPEVVAKVGRWDGYRGVIADDGTLHYLAKDGHTRKEAAKGTYTVTREL